MKQKLVTGALLAALASGVSAQEFYMGQIVQFGSFYCPRGTLPASGQLLQIAEHTALYSLFSNKYGGDGRATFALPDLRAKDANGNPIPPNQPGAGMLHCVVEQGYYPPRD